MSKTTRILSLSLISVCALGARSAFAQLLPGNVWPNPTLETAAAPGVDQVYSYYNGTHPTGGPYVPNATGDTNPRPDGWHRGNGDFGVTGAPAYCFWDTSKSLSATHSLLVNDTSTANSGEWFSDYNAVPASSQMTGVPFHLRFNWQYTNVQPRTEVFRVSVRWADVPSQDIMTINNDNIAPNADMLIPGGSPDVTTWTQVDELLTPPIGAGAMRITIDSGGGSAATGQIWVDDISVSSVPEPASLGVIGAGTMLLAARRRRA